MRRIIGVTAALLFLSGAVALQAQSEDEQIFVKTVPIVKIYAHPFGYKVLYLKSDLELGECYLPLEWFFKAGGKGDIVWGYDSDYPYFSVFWKNGKFDHIRLYLLEYMGSETWGRLSGGEELRPKFRIDTLELEF